MKVDQVVDNILKKYKQFNNSKELSAVITHWLQAPDTMPPLMTDDIFNALISYFSDESKGSSKRSKLKVREDSKFYQLRLPLEWHDIPYPPPNKWNFTFIDLFAGIGGFRQAFQGSGGKCVFSSEWDEYAKRTYQANYGETPYGDIRQIPKESIPDHDVLCAGFPCQPFSLAGVSKKNSLGRKHGFEDETQGTLFFEIKEILRIKRPKAFMLENVKNLLSHDKGKTFQVIRETLEDNLKYVINWKVVDGSNWVPQHRERIYIVGYDPKQINICKNDIIIPETPQKGYEYPQLSDIIAEYLDGYTLGIGTWDTLKRHKIHHTEQGNGFGYGLHKLPIPFNAVTRTISARYHKDGAEILIEQKGKRPRRLSVEEAMQLQGYDPNKLIFPVSKTQAYKQIGNSVVVPAIKETALEIAKVLRNFNQ